MRTIEQKNEIIDNLTLHFNNNDCFYIVELSKIKVSDISMFRRSCRKNDISFIVAKNSLIHRALQNSKFNDSVKQETEAIMNNMSGVLFVNEKHKLPAKVILEFLSTTTSGEIKLKCACVDSDIFIGHDKLRQLSKLKSRNELIADVISLLQSPMKNVMSGLLSAQDKLCGVLKTLAER